MELSISQNRISWQFEGNSVCIEVPSLRHAIYAAGSQVIVTLSAQTAKENIISIFDQSGHVRLTVKEPEGIKFNCIGGNRDKDVAVMAKVYKSGWCDWWYSINLFNGELSSLGEGR